MFGTEVGLVAMRLVIIFGVGLVVVRLMGNRTVGQLSPFDFVLMVGVGDIITGVAFKENQAIFIGIEALIAILILQQLISWLSLKNRTSRKWFEGVPITLVEKGKILPENLRKCYFNFDDLRQELHKNGIDMASIKDIKIARLESCGDVSIILNQEAESFTRRYFQDYVESMNRNPLSPMGKTVRRVEQLMADLNTISEHLQQQDNNKSLHIVRKCLDEQKQEVQ